MVSAVAVSKRHGCFIQQDGTVKCWGDTSSGELGFTSASIFSDPVTVNLGASTQISQVAVGDGFSCVVSTTLGKVFCWGANASALGPHGITSLASTDVKSLPVLPSLAEPANIERISAGGGILSVLYDDGSVFSGPPNSYLATTEAFGATPAVIKAPLVAGLIGVESLSTSSSGLHGCAIFGGGVYCWATAANGNSAGQLGSTPAPVVIRQATPVPSIVTGAVSVVAGDAHSCALLNTGVVKCWGDNSKRQLGDSTFTLSSSVVPRTVNNLPVGPGKTVGAIFASANSTCARFDDAEVSCWGVMGGPVGTGGPIGTNDVDGTDVVNPLKCL
jgi:alpha-tubulin suppressor-like RCC1 family protein